MNYLSLADYESTDTSEKSITKSDGSKVAETYIGSICLTDTFTLHVILYVPGFKYNLVSVPIICNDLQCSVIFDGDDCLLQSSSMKTQLLGSLNHSLYYVLFSTWISSYSSS